ncbi:FlgL Flagellin and related hook-associated proteins [Burkholderiaceae bacterium]
MAVINTNVKALFSQAALKSTERSQAVNMQQLSTGKRINSSRDDAAGMAIATRMTQQIRSLNQAVRNAGDAVTLIQTAEGATNEITDMMQRMRELAIQASNDTNNNDQRSYLDLEFQQLKKQIVQIADNTEWNGFPVLNGTTGERVGIKPVYKTISEPVGSTDLTFTAAKPTTTSATVGIAGVNEVSTVTFKAMVAGDTVEVGGLTYTANKDNSPQDVAEAFSNISNGAAGATLSAIKGDFTGTLTGFSSGTNSSEKLSFTAVDQLDTSATTLVLGGSIALDPPELTTEGVTNTLGRTEVSTVTFPPMSAGQTMILAGLTYTAKIANSGAEVAAAFADIAAGKTAGNSLKGSYSGTLTAFSTGSAQGSKVEFTSTTKLDVNLVPLSQNGTATTPTISTTPGLSGGGILLEGAFSKAGTLSILAGGVDSVTSAKFTLEDGQTLDISSGVTIAGGVITINKQTLARAGMNILSGDVTLTQVTPASGAATAADFEAGDRVSMNVTRSVAKLEPMYASDAIINGVTIGASRMADDKISPEGNAWASAIAKVAAINEKSISTGVQAVVNSNIMTGAAMSSSGAPVTGTLRINGFITPMVTTVTDNPRDSRIAMVKAINFIADQTGVRAIDTLSDTKGITLVAEDGRNIEVVFNTASTDKDFSEKTGLKQGIQAGSYSLESTVETPVTITSGTNGNISRSGLEVMNYDSKTLSTVTSKDRAAVTAVKDIKSLAIGDLRINGVDIRAAVPSDDGVSNTQSVTSTAVASAIATAAAINASTSKTGVTAVAVPVKIEGNVTSIAKPIASVLAASNGVQSLYINGVNIQVSMSDGDTESERRTAVVAAIHKNAGLSGVDAVDTGNGGVTLNAVDGRNVSVWFDSTKVDAGSFGLGFGTESNLPSGVSGIPNANNLTTTAATSYGSIALQSEKAITLEPGDNGFNVDGDFYNLGFSQGTFGGQVDEATSKMSPPRTGRLAFQVGANANQQITIDLADFGKGGPITGEITWDADLEPLAVNQPIPVPEAGGPSLMGKPLTRTSISSSEGAQAVLAKLDSAMDKVNQTRATMGAVMNRLDHVISNLTNVSMNLSTSRSQIEDADYASASTELAKNQIMQQAATAVLAQANTSQQSVMKLLGG